LGRTYFEIDFKIIKENYKLIGHNINYEISKLNKESRIDPEVIKYLKQNHDKNFEKTLSWGLDPFCVFAILESQKTEVSI
jgi:hypothetical protein